LKAKWLPVVNEGLKNLDHALELDPNYVDAMAYENLLFRERADPADGKPEYEKDVKTADGWMQKTLDTKKRLDDEKSKKAASGGIVQETK